jgi:preprotein translocase subunit SecG
MSGWKDRTSLTGSRGLASWVEATTGGMAVLAMVAIIAMGVLGAGANAALAASRRRFDPVTAD